MFKLDIIYPNSIILVGFMGSGKTSIGKALSSKLGYKFYDTDEMISDKYGNSIAQIFEKEGEAYFRMLENQLTEELRKVKNAVISTGGGLPVFYDNMEILNATGETIYLKNSVRRLTERIFMDKSRPLVKEYNSKSQLNEYVKNVLSSRKVFYSKSKHIINCQNKTIEEIVNEILIALNK
jgi:shikimate kinase